MKSQTLLLVVAIFAVVLSILGTVITFVSINNFKNTWITGFPTYGVANITVEKVASHNFTYHIINFGTGSVSPGALNASLITSAGANNVTSGNWTGNSAGWLVENIGNTNLTFDLQSNLTAAQWIGGTNPGFWWNVTANESLSCVNASGVNFTHTAGNATTLIMGAWFTANASMRICDRFQFIQSRNSLRIDIHVDVPSDSKSGLLNNTVFGVSTATN